MEKKFESSYETPRMETVEIEVEDVILDSAGGSGENLDPWSFS